MKVNRKVKETISPVAYTHNGAKVKPFTPEQQLRRSVMNCLLWEDQFYEDGQSIAQRILDLTAQVNPTVTAELAIEARHQGNLRHVPLLLLVGLLRHGKGSMVGNTIGQVVSRVDEIAELISLYWTVAENKKMLPSQMKKGLGIAFNKFDEYQFGKWNRDGQIKLKDALFLVHPKAKNKQQQASFDKIVNDSLKTPDTWEVALSTGADKNATFTRLLGEDKLGYLAILRNLRNMEQAGVNGNIIRQSLAYRGSGFDKVLPFRFIAAWRHAPSYASELHTALMDKIAKLDPLLGKTLVLVDVSGSMDHKLSGKSDLTRMDAAAALAAIVPGDTKIFTFSTDVKEVNCGKGLFAIEKIINSQWHGGTLLQQALTKLKYVPHDRLIVITDEQSSDVVLPVKKDSKSYMINVASYQNGVSSANGWKQISGFSENVFKWIAETEKFDAK